MDEGRIEIGTIFAYNMKNGNSWAEVLKTAPKNYEAPSHTTNSEGKPEPFEHVDRTKSVRASYAGMKVLMRNGKIL